MISAKDVTYPAKFRIITMCELKIPGMKRGRILQKGIYEAKTEKDFPTNDGIKLNKNFELLSSLTEAASEINKNEQIDMVPDDAELGKNIQEEIPQQTDIISGYSEEDIKKMKRKMRRAKFINKGRYKPEIIVKKYQEFIKQKA